MDYVDIKYEWSANDGTSKKDLADYILANLDDIIAEANEIILPKLAEKAEEAVKKIIQDWYGGHDPSRYSRIGDMEDVVKVKPDGDAIVVTLDSSAMGGHRMPDDKLYELTFKQGLHGGPIWRKPYPYFTYPLGPAVSSPAPFPLIKPAIDQCVDEMYPEALALIKSIALRYIKSFKR